MDTRCRACRIGNGVQNKNAAGQAEPQPAADLNGVLQRSRFRPRISGLLYPYILIVKRPQPGNFDFRPSLDPHTRCSSSVAIAHTMGSSERVFAPQEGIPTVAVAAKRAARNQGMYGVRIAYPGG